MIRTVTAVQSSLLNPSNQIHITDPNSETDHYLTVMIIITKINLQLKNNKNTVDKIFLHSI